MKLLLIGGTKFIGRATVQRAVELGHEVAVFHRGKHEPEGMDDVDHIHGDTLEIADHVAEIRAFGPEAVIDTTQFETATTQAVVDCLTGIVDRYVLLSSKDVYISYGRIHRTEPGPPQPMPIAEDGELRKLPGFGHTEEIDNLYAERVALGQQELPVTVTRLAAVFGPHDSQRRIGIMLDKLRESDVEIKLHPALANFRWTWGYVYNIADMLLICAGDRRPGNHIYNLGFPSGVTNGELHRMVADVIGWKGEIVLTEDGTKEPEQDLSNDWISDTSKFRRDFGYTERISLEEAVRLTVGDELAENGDD